MSVWGHRDSEPPPEEARPGEARPGEARPGEAHQAEPEGRETQEPAGPERPAEEPAPAFWRAQGETPSYGRAPAAAPPLAYGHVPADALPEDAPAPPYGEQAPGEAPAPPYGQQAPGEAPAPAVSESPAGTGAPVPVLTGKVVVLDGETVVQDPALTGTAEDQAGPHDAEAGDQAMTWAQQPGAWEPSVTGAPEPAVAEAQQPAATEVQQPGVRPAAPAAASPAEAAPASTDGISAQRWSEILVSFVDDPRSSVQMAAGVVDEAIDEFVNSVRARQRALASSWQGTDTGTEQLRTALRDYRKLWHQVRQLDLGEQKGA
ncbi:MAG TPA: hypothetical protein VGI05_13505 [Streptosporangiaceae bacterium]